MKALTIPAILPGACAALAISLLGACAAPPGHIIPPEVLAACRAEGGCTLYSAERLDEVLQAAYDLGAASVGGQGCKRGAI